MQIQAAQTQGSSTTPAPSAGSALGGALGGNDFMKLLMAQLKAQDPLQPMDPTAMVGQLVQFNMLDQLVQIRQAVQTPSSNAVNPFSGK